MRSLLATLMLPAVKLKKYSPDQERDEKGRFAGGGSGGGSSRSGASAGGGKGKPLFPGSRVYTVGRVNTVHYNDKHGVTAFQNTKTGVTRYTQWGDPRVKVQPLSAKDSAQGWKGTHVVIDHSSGRVVASGSERAMHRRAFEFSK